MLFKNFTAFELTRPIIIGNLEDFHDALNLYAPRLLRPTEQTNEGFTDPFPVYRPGCKLAVIGHAEPEYHLGEEDLTTGPLSLPRFSAHASDALVLTYFLEEKVIVSSAIKRELAARVQEIETTQVRKVFRSEQNEIKAEIVARVLPNAQTRYSEVPMVFLPGNKAAGYEYGMLLVGAIGAKADRALGKLRTILGTLPVRAITPALDPVTVLTDLAKRQQGTQNNTSFRITNDFQMQELGESASIASIARMKNTDIEEDSVVDFLAGSARAVTHAQLLYKDEASFRLDPKFLFRGLKVNDNAYDAGMDDQDEVDARTYSYSNAVIESGLLINLLVDLLELFGGIGSGAFDAAREKDPEPVVITGIYRYQRSNTPDPNNPDGGSDDDQAEHE